MSFLGEIKRRKVFQVAVVYAVVAWLIVQIVATVEGPLSLPDWFDTAVIVALAIGFPIAVVLAWAFDLTPDGVVRDEGGVSAQRGGRKIEYALFGLLVVAVGWIGFRELNPPVSDMGGSLPNSVAILPFENMSVDPNDSFFAAGIHDEIINQVANIQDLNVIARTSVMQYEGARRPITEIARELRVTSVLEGSVSYAGERVRIRALLFNGATGETLWSEVFQSDLSDVFGIYADLSARIADSLQAELLPAERERIATAPTDSPAAYALYLSALEARRLVTDAELAIQLLDSAIEYDSNFALAHATKAHILGFRYVDEVTQAARTSLESATAVADQLERTINEHAERALDLDSQLGLAHSALGIMHMRHWRKEQTEAAFVRALALSPKNPEILNWYSLFSSWTDNHERAIELSRRAAAFAPQHGLADLGGNAPDPYFWAGNYDIAAQRLQDAIAATPNDAFGYFYLAEIEAARGDYVAAIEHLRLFEQLIDYEVQGTAARAAYVYSLGGRPEDAARVFALIEELAIPASAMQLAVDYLAIGDTEESLRLFQEAAENRLPASGATLAIMIKRNIYNDPVLEQPDFVEVRRRLGFRE